MEIKANNEVKQKLLNTARENFISVSGQLYRNKLPEVSLHKVTLSSIKKISHCTYKKPIITTSLEAYDYSMNEDNSPKIWVSFANENLGGGFLGKGYVQEEVITFEFYQMAETIVEAKSSSMKIDEAYIFKNLIRSSISDPRYYGIASKAELSAVKTIQIADFLAINAPDRKPKEREDPYTKHELQHLCIKSLSGFAGCVKVGHKEINTGNWGAGDYKNRHSVVYFVQFLSAWLSGIEVVNLWMYNDIKETNDVMLIFAASDNVRTFFAKGMKLLRLGNVTLEELYSYWLL